MTEAQGVELIELVTELNTRSHESGIVGNSLLLLVFSALCLAVFFLTFLSVRRPR